MTDDTDDIVTRLRRFKRGPCIDAADEIERLRAEVERLQALWCEARSQSMTFHEQLEEQRKGRRP